MTDSARRTTLETFLAASFYRDSVDLKKLRFVYAALEDCARSKGIPLSALRILEVACGRGGITLPLATLGCAVTGFDLETDHVEELRREAERRGYRDLTLSVANGYDFDDGKTYDVVIASEVFEHVLEPARLAANIRRRMAPGARLIATTPNGYGPWELKNRLNPLAHVRRWAWLRQRVGKPAYQPVPGEDHCQFYTQTRFQRIMQSQGFRARQRGSSDAFLTVLGLLRHWDWLARLDCSLADHLPYWMASGWYFTFELSDPISEAHA